MTESFIYKEAIISFILITCSVWLIRGIRIIGHADNFIGKNRFRVSIAKIGIMIIEAFSWKKSSQEIEKINPYELLSILLSILVFIFILLSYRINAEDIFIYTQLFLLGVLLNLMTLEFLTRSWQDLAAIFVYYSRNVLSITVIVYCSYFFAVQNPLIHWVDFVFSMVCLGRVYHSAIKLCRSQQEETISDLSLLSLVVVLTTFFVSSNSLIYLDHRLWEIGIIALLSIVVLSSFTSNLYARSLLTKVEYGGNQYSLLIGFYFLFRLLIWIL